MKYTRLYYRMDMRFAEWESIDGGGWGGGGCQKVKEVGSAEKG